MNMELLKNLVLIENQKASFKELNHICTLIGKSYKEWRKIRRRINAVDLVTTTVNRIVKIHPSCIKFLNAEMQLKLGLLLMRCMDCSYWKPLDSKEKIYKKLFPLIDEMQSFKLNTGTGGNVGEIIMTRLSANMSMQNKSDVFVSYEPTVPMSYEDYLFGDTMRCKKIYKMSSLRMPEDYNELLNILKINLKKAEERYKSSFKDK